jgi:hypothetical protein
MAKKRRKQNKGKVMVCKIHDRIDTDVFLKGMSKDPNAALTDKIIGHMHVML